MTAGKRWFPVLPLVIAQLDPGWIGDLHVGFAGISYVTFRVLDVLWAIAMRRLAG